MLKALSNWMVAILLAVIGLLLTVRYAPILLGWAMVESDAVALQGAIKSTSDRLATIPNFAFWLLCFSLFGVAVALIFANLRVARAQETHARAPQPIIVESPRPQISHTLTETGVPHEQNKLYYCHVWEVRITSPFTPHMLTVAVPQEGLVNLWAQASGITQYRSEGRDNPPCLCLIWNNPPKEFRLHATTKHENPAPTVTFEFG